MSEEQKRILESKLWDIANILRGKMNANQFQDVHAYGQFLKTNLGKQKL